MNNFTYYNPVRIVFGRGSIAQLQQLVPTNPKILLVYGGGSIKHNGVYEQVQAALNDHDVIEFAGIEPNPLYETCIKAADLVKQEGVGFLLAVGGGSVMDATKFIAAAAAYTGADPWDMVLKKAPVTDALPLGCVVTLPATGSETNINAVISRASTAEKIPFKSPLLYPQFSILDPDTTFSLPQRQLANGIVDTFVHVCEQYLTYDVHAHLQDRQAEAILLTLIQEAPKLFGPDDDYDVRANLMWCATQALNHNLACGVPMDWSTHAIGHELTAACGIDHARALAIVMPALLDHQRVPKADKLLKFAHRIWGITCTDTNAAIDTALQCTRKFFQDLGMPTRLSDAHIPSTVIAKIANRLGQRCPHIGEHQNLDTKAIRAILEATI
ncbi:NADPH-dependent aldehyde reductase [Syntrophotalea carbinolica DSM 2380]|uniref:NADPH-dependent aldehyde reductase n=1 Tax=Syntrophotalea carbinolica (strain DSM 2380 / NBRC 103641 / GraBd1) TaxID=338963 RepID=Q3A3W4_SYNC1|nr:iron-containing alcohol dehydrogenase [Syntrophotalea carbinolica]ABA88943.1 NADPH-dependent aldehyde reductase [Syntrophotalea carbinolica DSM 2380]